jgi:hypothetical protein
LSKLIEKISKKRDIFIFHPGKKLEIKQLYTNKSAFMHISSNPNDSEFVFVDIAAICKKLQKPGGYGAIVEKVIVPKMKRGHRRRGSRGRGYKTKSTIEDFDILFSLMLTPAHLDKYMPVAK